MKKLTILFAVMLLLCGCSYKAPVLESPASDMVETPGVETTGEASPDAPAAPVPSDTAEKDTALSLGERMASQSFVLVSGKYARNCIEDDMEYTEMFVTDKSSFVRAASDESEEEVFAYNYASDQFTYLYYFEGELLSKVVYSVDADTVLEDTDGLAELLKSEAQALKTYFYALLNAAGIGVEELQ